MILDAEDVGEHRDALAFLDQPHRDARDRRLDRARRRPSAPSSRAHTVAIDDDAVGLEDVAHDAGSCTGTWVSAGITGSIARSASAP